MYIYILCHIYMCIIFLYYMHQGILDNLTRTPARRTPYIYTYIYTYVYIYITYIYINPSNC